MSFGVDQKGEARAVLRSYAFGGEKGSRGGKLQNCTAKEKEGEKRAVVEKDRSDGWIGWKETLTAFWK